MSNQDRKYPYPLAAKVANYIFEQLQPHCDRIHIAGSIRRLRPEIKDIEIVCQPKKVFEQKGLFPEDGDWLISKDFSEALALIAATILKGNVTGRYMQIKTCSKNCPGIVLDLFMPQPDDYFRQLAIRTGSAEYSHGVIAAAWKRKGWVGIKDLGLRKMNQCIQKQVAGSKKKYWVLNPSIKNPETPPAWQNEGELFHWLGISWTDPEFRELHQPNYHQ